MSAGNKNKAGVSTFASILSYAGKAIKVWENGQWVSYDGWSMGEFINFPNPVGRRRVQLCDVPGLELFPQIYHAENVIFKAGVELTVFNYALSILARLRKYFARLPLSVLAKPLVKASRLFQLFGSYSGSIMVWVTDRTGITKSLGLLAVANGPRIAATPAVLLAQKILSEEITIYGAFPCINFLNFHEIESFLNKYGIVAIYSEGNNV